MTQIRDFIDLILEGKDRSIRDLQSRDKDLRASLTRMISLRDQQKRGSGKRYVYARAVEQIKREIRANEKLIAQRLTDEQ